jgi:fumarylacetoacetate (FAA) hydrolase
MKLCTVDDGTRDGRLHVVARDLSRAVPATGIADTLQAALEDWSAIAPKLQALAAALEGRSAQSTIAFDPERARAPLPRAWQWLDGSAFQSHGDLMSTVFGLEKQSYAERPLMYQGLSDRFLSGNEPAPFPSEADGIDFEGEFGVIVDAVPMGVSRTEAARHIRLIVLINDWSLRVLAPIEMKTGFGWIQAKPACSVAPIAITPDELGDAWRDARVQLPLHVWWNGKPFGAARGGAMSFGFDQLVAHAARTRELVAGTIIGSGTVSNENYREVGSSCIAERRGIEMLDHGTPQTAFMKFGERVRMEAYLPDGGSVFGAIDQEVVEARR